MSIHDVSPRHETQVDRLYARLQASGVDRIAMLVVPNFWGEAPIIRGSAFARRLRDWASQGVEMFLHGSLHRDDSRHRSAIGRFKATRMTAGEGEFLGLDANEAAQRIGAGRALIEDITGRSVAGFVAPAWLYGAGALDALATADIGLVEDHWKVWNATSGQVLARSPVITWATRTAMRRASSLVVAALARNLPGPRVMRIAVHPNDTTDGNVLRSIAGTVETLRRRRIVSCYDDLVLDQMPRLTSQNTKV